MNNNIRKPITSDERKALEREMEEAMLIQQANENNEYTLGFSTDGEFEVKSELADMMLDAIDNPEEKYEVYYKLIDRVLRKHLPTGKENEKYRNLIYEEKNTFLTRGHRMDASGRRGADGRQAYLPDMHEFVNIISEWLNAGANMFDLYIRLRDLNKSKGYPMD